LASIREVAARFATMQHGVVTRRQLLASGISRYTIDGCIRRGELRVLHAGVYQVGPIAGPRVREMAAMLACDGVASHRSAAALRGLVRSLADEAVDITVAPGRRVVRPGIRVHRCALEPGDIESLDGVRLTSLPRTLFDFAEVATSRELERALATAERSTPALRVQLELLLQLHPRRRGTRLLRELLRPGEPAFTRSEAEDLLLQLVRAGGLTEPKMNVFVGGYEVDCYWGAARLAVEVDGYAWHGSQRAHVRDRQRDSALAARGIQVLRLSWHQLSRERELTLVQLALALARADDRSATLPRG
jgi:very-short-patch-repair endonuclease